MELITDTRLSRIQVLPGCVCGREPSQQIKINIRLARRGMWMVGISLGAIVVSVFILGLSVILSRGWWVFAIYATIFTFITKITIQRTSQGHTFRCALRYAALKVF